MLPHRRASHLFLPAPLISLFVLAPTGPALLGAEPSIIDNGGQYSEGLQVAMPDVYELVNIAIALTSFGETDPNYVDSDTPYHAEVLARFSAHKDHPFVKTIQENHGNVDGFNLLKMRAAASHFVGDEIVCDREQLYLPSEEDEAQLDEELSLAARFARDTGFRSFYEEHLPYYQERLEMFRAAVPARDAWEWLEAQFPARNQRIRIFLSPLTGWSHFAVGKTDYTDIYIFGPPEFLGSKTDEGWYAMALFTELDHKYVDLVSREHEEEIASVFSDVQSWNEQGGYRTPRLTFSEYMTWAVFCLYANDHYGAADFSQIKERTEEFMVTSRRFPRFGEFNDHLLALYRNREAGVTVPDLYPQILDWARNSEG